MLYSVVVVLFAHLFVPVYSLDFDHYKNCACFILVFYLDPREKYVSSIFFSDEPLSFPGSISKKVK